MKALIRKEIRSLLPAWLMAMVLAILPVWIVWPGPEGAMVGELGMLVFAPFALGVLVLCLTPFGQELNWGTFSVLLAQPIPRRTVWSAKVITLAIALGCVFLALCVSNHIRVDSTLETMKHTVWRNAFDRPGQQYQYFLKFIEDTRRSASLDTLMVGGLAVLVGFAGGLWTTLLFRQVTAAFWVTLLAPLGITIVTANVFRSLPDVVSYIALAIVLGSYSAVSFTWARRFFLRVQDTQWTGGVVSLPSWGGIASASSSAPVRRRYKPVLALWRKEFQAQQINLLLAGGLLLAHLGTIAVRRWGTNYLETHHSVGMSLEMVPLLWLVMALLVGCVAVPEERKVGTFQSSLCLPSSRFVQFAVRLFVALALGIFLAGILPLLVECLAGPHSLVRLPSGLFILGADWPTIFLQSTGAVGLTLLSFYGSTLTRNALQAMGAALLATVLVVAVMFGAQHAEFSELILWRGRLIEWIGWPVMSAVLLVLAYRNHNVLLPTVGTWMRNGLTLFLALAGVSLLTTTIYHRVWEAWIPEEPLHAVGFNFLNEGINPQFQTRRLRSSPKLQATASERAVVFPNGRLWLDQKEERLSSGYRFGRAVAWQKFGPRFTGFVDGSDWKDVALTPSACFGLKAEGTLWDLSQAESGKPKLEQVGVDRDWSAVACGLEHFCALKSDGTLWQWGRKQNQASPFLPGPLVSSPVQVGSDDDWMAICDSWFTSVAMKTDGTVWRWEWNSRTRARPAQWLISPCTRPVSISLSSDVIACVCADGSLWIGGALTNFAYERLVGPQLSFHTDEMVRWGNDSDWKEIHFVGWGRVVGLKKDGSLWEWDYRQAWPVSSGGVQPTRPSFYSDWVAVCSDENAFVSFARDGNLCLWGDPEAQFYSDWGGLPDERRWLMPSRIKARRITNFYR